MLGAEVSVDADGSGNAPPATDERHSGDLLSFGGATSITTTQASTKPGPLLFHGETANTQVLDDVTRKSFAWCAARPPAESTDNHVRRMLAALCFDQLLGASPGAAHSMGFRLFPDAPQTLRIVLSPVPKEGHGAKAWTPPTDYAPLIAFGSDSAPKGSK